MRAFVWTLAVGVVLMFALLGCPPTPNPAPVPPDANDAAPLVDTDGASPLCADACAHLASLGCPVAPDCATVMARIEARKLVRTGDGRSLTCAMVSAAGSKDVERALGVGCP